MNQKAIEREFFEVLRSALWDKDISATTYNIDGIMLLASRQSFQPIFFDYLLKGGKISKEKESLIKDFLFCNINTHRYLNTILLKIVKAFSDKAVPYVLLKGQGLASLYLRPEYRTCGDIDLLIPDMYLDKAIEIVNNFSDEQSVRKAYFSDKHYHVCVNGITVEIHFKSAIMPNRKMMRIFTEYEKEGLEILNRDTIYIEDTKVMVPEATFNLLFTFYHALHHFVSGGIGLRQFCDLACFLSKKYDRIDIVRFKSMLYSLGLYNQWQTFMSILVEYLGLDRKYALFYNSDKSDKARKIVNLILKEGNFGNFSRFRVSNSIVIVPLRKMRNFISSTLRTLTIFTLFPGFVTKHYLAYFKSRISNIF